MTVYFHSSQKGEIRDRVEKLFLATGLQRKSPNKQKCCSLGASASYLLRCKVLLQSPITSTRYLYTSRPNIVLLFLPLAQPVDVYVKWIVHRNRKNMSYNYSKGLMKVKLAISHFCQNLEQYVNNLNYLRMKWLGIPWRNIWWHAFYDHKNVHVMCMNSR